MMKTIRNIIHFNLMKHDFSLEIFVHSNNVANIAMKIADEMQLSVEEKHNLYEEALYHDIGKSRIPESILYKKGKLVSEEWEVMKKHAIYSEDLYLSMGDNNSTIIQKAKSIRHHHENWDGSGYPDKLAGEEIPLHSRIIRIADIFDAITQTRVYRPYSIENPLEVLEMAEGKEIDPYIFAKSYNILQHSLRKNGIA